MAMWDQRFLWLHVAVASSCCCTLATSLNRKGRSAQSSLAFLRSRGSTPWNYQDGGASWSSDYGQCGGTSQSPVNVSSTVALEPTDADKFFYAYPKYEAPVKMVNSGHWLEADIDNEIKDDGSSVGGIGMGTHFPTSMTARWDLYRIVIHTPSEHTFLGLQTPLELQLFHRLRGSSDQGEPAASETAVVSIGFVDGGISVDEPSPFLEALREGGLPHKRGEEKLVNRAYPSHLNFDQLFRPVLAAHGEKATFWEYNGSLTAPPCSEPVRWFLRHEPLPASKEALEEFADAAEASIILPMQVFSNARALQPVGQRPVYQRFAEGGIALVTKKQNDTTQKAFYDTVERAEKYQQQVKDGLAAHEAHQAGGTSKAVEADQYASCIQELGATITKLTEAQQRQTIECDREAELQTAFDEAGAGATKTEAATKLAVQQYLCKQEGDIVSALEGEKESTQAKCDDLKQDSEKAASDSDSDSEKAAATETTAATESSGSDSDSEQAAATETTAATESSEPDSD
mmetsp:Transcript_46207/g.81292  ORF Transcript_46207/g.81292 Transcript_46207/m.81292 type:complete len:516 (+) Transcript_46207:82-1629(+)